MNHIPPILSLVFIAGTVRYEMKDERDKSAFSGARAEHTKQVFIRPGKSIDLSGANIATFFDVRKKRLVLIGFIWQTFGWATIGT
jgi:hypothetical protein